MVDKKYFFTLKSIEYYNRFRAPEAEARLVDVKGDEIVVEFTGSFCHTCGIRDWVEDLAYVMKSLGGDAVLKEYIEPEGEEDYKRIGVFKILKIPDERVDE
ncbi:hypothetical protein ACSU1N_06635 [Thermogladius sp. 4427co]|uniref:hypothetical protein n=1 Tax=Thermogladius sp. 4427co TaxID=3450718 RepID=UPI003F7A071D